MTDLWMPGATRRDVGNHAPTDGGPSKAIAHITWDRNATKAKPVALVPYEDLVSYFTGGGKGVASHILWDPFTGRFTQFFPADSRSLSLEDHAGGTRTNRAGKYVIQVETLFFPYCEVDGKVYAKLTDTPCKGWDKLNAWTLSLGIPNVWPNGAPTAVPNRNEHNWETQAGWYGHGDTPENSHIDPLSWPAWPKLADTGSGSTGGTTKPKYEPFPGASFFAIGRKSPIITAMGKRLVAKGCGRYRVGPGPEFSEADKASYAAWQRKLGYSGSGADGIPGKTSWDELQVPNV